MHCTLRLQSPAKLNLCLHITGQRADGYHLLQTAFQLLDFHDTCTLTSSSSPDIRLSSNLDLPQSENLAYKAARLLKKTTGVPFGARIDIEKRIPTGAGMGGGSSNAATVLVGLNTLWQTGLSVAELSQLGLSLGADVPVFVLGQSAWAEGIGEKLHPICLPERWFVIIKPPCHIDTRKIFSSSQLTRETPSITVSAFLAQGGHNDCQPVVLQHYPDVANAFNWLSQYGPTALTGTGSCIFATYTDVKEATRVYELAKHLSHEAYLAKAINLSEVGSLHNTIGV